MSLTNESNFKECNNVLQESAMFILKEMEGLLILCNSSLHLINLEPRIFVRVRFMTLGERARRIDVRS